MVTDSQINEAMIYWDKLTPDSEGWVWRLEYSDGWHEQGYWLESGLDDEDNLKDAVVDLLYQSGIGIHIDDVAVENRDGGYAIWTRPAEETE